MKTKTVLLFLAVLISTALAVGDIVSLSWDPNPATDHVTQYNIYKRAQGESSFLPIGHTTLVTFPASGIVAGDAFQVTAVNASGESQPSAIVIYAPSPTPTATPVPTPIPPTGVKVKKL